MTTNEYLYCILEVKKETSTPQTVDEAAAYEAAQLISGSFVYPLYGALWQNDFDMDTITEHLESMYDSGNRDVPPNIDNMLCVTNDGRKLALDQRIINPLLPDDPDGKVSTCVNNIFRIWEKTREDCLAQLVFSDLSTPKTAIESVEVDGVYEAAAFQNVYDDIRKKLIAKGVPAEEIQFIHDADTEAKKKELFAKVRKGQVRVVLGSTQKMGAGTNMQDRLIALHDLDCPWRPADVGRALRIVIITALCSPCTFPQNEI